MLTAQRERLERLQQVLDHVEQNDDVRRTDAREVGGVRRSLQDMQTRAPAVLGRLCGKLDAHYLEMPRRLHQKKTVGTSELKQLAVRAIAANEIDAAGELASQHRLSAEIVGIPVGPSAGKIVLSIIGGGIEGGGLRAAEAAGSTLDNVAAVAAEAKCVRRRATAGRAQPREFASIAVHRACLKSLLWAGGMRSGWRPSFAPAGRAG